jgi:hypothetical protein
VEQSVWTERMLTRLTTSEPADRVWFSLLDKTYAPANLQSALDKVWRKGGSAGAEGQTVAHFERKAEAELARLHEQMRAGTYRPQPGRRAWIPKPGSKEPRPLGIPAVRDRIVQGALRHVLEPIFEAEFAGQNYGFRPGRGAKDALRRVDTLLKAGHVWMVEADLKSYCDTIPQDRLLARVKERVAEGRVLACSEISNRRGRGAGRSQGLATHRTGPAPGRGHQSAVGQRLSQSAGPAHGTSGLGEGALCRRLRDSVSQRSGGPRGFGGGGDVGERGGTDLASGQDASGGREATGRL